MTRHHIAGTLNTMLFAFRQLPEILRMSVTAILGVGIGYLTYELIYFLNPFEPRASISWLIAFIIGIVRQHALHRGLSFNHPTPYWKSLFRAYVMYSASLMLGSGLNWYLTVQLDMHHRLAWLVCLILTAGISLITLKSFVFKKNWN